MWDEQTFEGWDNVFRTNVSSRERLRFSRSSERKTDNSPLLLAFFVTAAFLPLLQKYTCESGRTVL